RSTPPQYSRAHSGSPNASSLPRANETPARSHPTSRPPSGNETAAPARSATRPSTWNSTTSFPTASAARPASTTSSSSAAAATWKKELASDLQTPALVVSVDAPGFPGDDPVGGPSRPGFAVSGQILADGFGSGAGVFRGVLAVHFAAFYVDR